MWFHWFRLIFFKGVSITHFPFLSPSGGTELYCVSKSDTLTYLHNSPEYFVLTRRYNHVLWHREWRRRPVLLHHREHKQHDVLTLRRQPQSAEDAPQVAHAPPEAKQLTPLVHELTHRLHHVPEHHHSDAENGQRELPGHKHRGPEQQGRRGRHLRGLHNERRRRRPRRPHRARRHDPPGQRDQLREHVQWRRGACAARGCHEAGPGQTCGRQVLGSKSTGKSP